MGRVGEELGGTLEVALNAGYGMRETGNGIRAGEIRKVGVPEKSEGARYSLNNANDV